MQRGVGLKPVRGGRHLSLTRVAKDGYRVLTPLPNSCSCALVRRYVGVINLLTFTQDEGFGATAFQHLILPTVPW